MKYYTSALANKYRYNLIHLGTAHFMRRVHDRHNLNPIECQPPRVIYFLWCNKLLSKP